MQLGLPVEWVDVMPEILLWGLVGELARKIGELLVGKNHVGALTFSFRSSAASAIRSDHVREVHSQVVVKTRLPTCRHQQCVEGTHLPEIHAPIQALSSSQSLSRRFGVAPSPWGLPA
jgi:hypothetical protein